MKHAQVRAINGSCEMRYDPLIPGTLYTVGQYWYEITLKENDVFLYLGRCDEDIGTYPNLRFLHCRTLKIFTRPYVFNRFVPVTLYVPSWAEIPR